MSSATKKMDGLEMCRKKRRSEVYCPQTLGKTVNAKDFVATHASQNHWYPPSPCAPSLNVVFVICCSSIFIMPCQSLCFPAGSGHCQAFIFTIRILFSFTIVACVVICRCSLRCAFGNRWCRIGPFALDSTVMRPASPPNSQRRD